MGPGQDRHARGGGLGWGSTASCILRVSQVSIHLESEIQPLRAGRRSDSKWTRQGDVHTPGFWNSGSRRSRRRRWFRWTSYLSALAEPRRDDDARWPPSRSRPLRGLRPPDSRPPARGDPLARSTVTLRGGGGGVGGTSSGAKTVVRERVDGWVVVGGGKKTTDKKREKKNRVKWR